MYAYIIRPFTFAFTAVPTFSMKFSRFLLLLSFLGMIYHFPPNFSYGMCNEGDSLLLLQMKQNLSFSPFDYFSYPAKITTALLSWNSSIDCCSWKGVTCNLSNGHVIGLDLSSESITSGIDNSSTLFKLKHLTHLNLAYNLFNSSIPSGLDQLANLAYLNLSNSGFRGQIPFEILRMKRLVSLDLSNIASSLKLEKPNLGTLCNGLRELRELILDGVNISMNGKEWSRALSSALPNLRVLSLVDCYLSGPLHPSLLKLQSLSKLRLDFNSISAPVPKFLGNFSHLTSLSLENCGLVGKFPESIFQLPQLQKIHLSSNPNLQGSLSDFPKNASLEELTVYASNFSGNLPESIGYLTQLQYLDLSNNFFNGTIPSTLFSLPLLQTLNLGHNHFSGQISEFPSGLSLVELYLSNNMLEGSVPLSIFKVPNLKVLALSYNNLNGTLELQMFQNFRNLDKLDLSCNDLWINTSEVDSKLFPQLTELGLGSSNLRKFPDFLSNQSGLGFLDLFNNTIPGKIPNWIGAIGNGNLFYLNISVNMLEMPDQPLPMGSLNSLVVLDLHSNLLKGQVPILPKSAYILDFSQNILTGEIPTSICSMENLRFLDLSKNNFSGEIPRCFIRLSLLHVVNLQRNNIHGVIPHIFPRECRLRTLDLNGNNIDGNIPKALANCVGLEVLNLGNNRLMGSFPTWLGELSELRVLILGSNNLYGPINYQRANNSYPKLHIVDLSTNNFTGNLPSELFKILKVMMTDEDNVHRESAPKILGFQVFDYSNKVYYQDVTVTNKGLKMEFVKILTFFASIDLSDNQFHGEIPQVLGELISLQVLNLSHNALTGSIPSSLGNLKQLESLDISNNMLGGRIPEELAKLNFLQVLNLAFNQLMGRIPAGGQLQTFSEVYFEGNDLLCGPPMSKACTTVVTNVPWTKYSNKLCKFSMFKNCHDHGKYNWQLISIALGYGVGMGLSFCVISCWQPWKRLYLTISKRVLRMD